MSFTIALLPVVVFLLLLFLLDSYKLVNKGTLLSSFVGGILCALLALLINVQFQKYSTVNFDTFSRYIAPLFEESLKALIIIVLIKQKKIGFLIDAAIYGFAVGAGFAVAENSYYLLNFETSNLLVWILRGLGTSLMHSGVTAILAMLLIGTLNREKKLYAGFGISLLIAYFIHSGFNHFYIQPVTQTLLISICIPSLLILIFKLNEKQLQDWLEVEFFNEVELLAMMRKGELKSTKTGKYLVQLKQHFSKEVIVDMYCYIEIFMELSVIAKRNIMLLENDFTPIVEPNLKAKLAELKQLQKNIGKTGELALSPLIRMNYRDLWKLNTLN